MPSTWGMSGLARFQSQRRVPHVSPLRCGFAERPPRHRSRGFLKSVGHGFIRANKSPSQTRSALQAQPIALFPHPPPLPKHHQIQQLPQRHLLHHRLDALLLRALRKIHQKPHRRLNHHTLSFALASSSPAPRGRRGGPYPHRDRISSRNRSLSSRPQSHP
jgi:hypothetical protein